MKDHRFQFMMNKDVKDRRKNLAKEHGSRSLSSVIEDLLRQWERDPSILGPTAVIDGGTQEGSKDMIKSFEALNLFPDFILLTHSHFDHVRFRP